uniref:Uncharacterized protein n=1 Tax=Aegilops tauschii subsp. strangulata TaxID=200361 RepID=A0A453QVN7_AEGTS
ACKMTIPYSFPLVKDKNHSSTTQSSGFRTRAPSTRTHTPEGKEMEAEAAERGRKERVAAVGHAGVEMEVDAGAEVEKAIEDGEIGGEGSEAEEEEGDGTGWEDD